jgi:outer membrane receptor protein involved in Fe transport
MDQSNVEFGVFTVYEAQGNTVPYYSSAAQKASGTDPKFDLSWKVNEDVMLYATASKGFRMGGANQPIPVAAVGNPNSVLVANECALQGKLLGTASCNPNILLQAPSTFSSDSVWNEEIGEKATFLDRRLELNTSVYHESWNNPQIATNLAGFGISVNGADATIWGAESELRALLGAGFELSANIGYTHATFNGDSAITGFDSGMNIPDTPKVTGALVLLSRQRVASDLELVGLIEYDYVGSRTDAPYGTTITLANVDSSLIHLPDYGLFGLRYGVHSDHWNVTAFATNLFNKETLLDPQPQINLQTAAFTRYTIDQPRTAGIDISYHFGR